MTMDAVLFDCDGVLVDSEVVGLEDSAEFLRSKGFSWGPDELIRRFTGKRDDRFRAELLQGYAEILGREPDENEGQSLFEGLLEARRASRHLMQAVPGAVETLRTVTKLGLRCAVASSSRQVYLDNKVERYGFSPYVFPHVYSAEHVAHGKPAPDIFLYAAERISADPSVCVVIEDSPFGVEAGVNAGMQVWGFTGGGHCLQDHAERLLAAGAIRIHTSHTALQKELIAVTQKH